MATSNDLKNGMVLMIDGQLWSVIEFQHVKPGKGPAFVRTKLRSVTTDKVVDKTFNAGVKVETANVDRRDMQYLSFWRIKMLSWPCTTAILYTSSFQHLLFLRLPTPSQDFREIDLPVATSLQPWKPDTKSRFRSLLKTTQE